MASELAAGNARLLELIAHAQERSLWSRWGALHPWQWVSWLTGSSPRLAKEHAVVADKLCSLPKTHEALGKGEISFCQASSIAKVERDDLEDEPVTLAKDLTQGQLDSVVRAYRRVSAPDDLDKVNDAHDRRYLHYFFSDDSFVLKGRLSKDDGALVAKALDVERDELFRESEGPAGESSIRFWAPSSFLPTRS